MKEKNLPKLKKELLKIFGSSLSISSNINLNSNQIKPTETDSNVSQTESAFKAEKPEDINITISLPQEKKQKNYKKKIKSLQNGKTYNIDIKKNEIPLKLYLNNLEKETSTPELLKPVNFVNYTIYRNANSELNSPRFIENKIIQKDDSKSIQNKKTEYVKEYVKILNSFKNTNYKKDIIQQNNSKTVSNTLFERPYTFLTNSETIVLSSGDTYKNGIENLNENKFLNTRNQTTNFTDKNIVNQTTNFTDKNIVNQTTNFTDKNIVNQTNSFLENVKFFEDENIVKIDNATNIKNKNVTVRSILENRTFKNVKNTTNITNLPATIPAFEKGGIVSKPTIALIGEKEPEIIIPKSKLPSIVSNEKTEGALQKSNSAKKINEFMKTGNTSIVPAIQSIEQNSKAKESFEQENIISKMTDNVPKFDRTRSSTIINSFQEQSEQPNLTINKVSTTKGIKQFIPETRQMPSWRSHSV